MPSAPSSSATVRISGRRRSSRTANLADAAWPARFTDSDLAIRAKGGPQNRANQNTTIAVIATDAALTKAQCNRLAVMAQDGFARAIYPVHTPLDGDVIFSAATGTIPCPILIMASPNSAWSPPM